MVLSRSSRRVGFAELSRSIGVTQADLAAMIGKSPSVVRQIEQAEIGLSSCAIDWPVALRLLSVILPGPVAVGDDVA